MDSQNIDDCIENLKTEKVSWCKVDPDDIRVAYLYALSKGDNNISFSFSGDDFARYEMTMELKR